MLLAPVAADAIARKPNAASGVAAWTERYRLDISCLAAASPAIIDEVAAENAVSCKDMDFSFKDVRNGDPKEL
jgi:hypothetical protein